MVAWIPRRWIIAYQLENEEGNLSAYEADAVLNPGTSLAEALTFFKGKIHPLAVIIAAGDRAEALMSNDSNIPLEDASPEQLVKVPWDDVASMIAADLDDFNYEPDPYDEETQAYEDSPAVMRTDLDSIAHMATGFPDANFWITAEGPREAIGKPTMTYDPSHIGIQVHRPDFIDSDYLFRVIEDMHAQGNFSPRDTGQSVYYLDANTLAYTPVLVQLS